MRTHFKNEISQMLDERGVGGADFFTNKILKTMEEHTARILEQRVGEYNNAVDSAEKDGRNAFASYAIVDEADVDDREDEDESNSDEEVQQAKKRQRAKQTKALVKKRVQKFGLVKGKWTPLPRDWDFPRGMTVETLIDRWLLSDPKTKVPPYCSLHSTHLSKKQRKIWRKMRALMGLVKKHGREKGCWVSDSPTNWTFKDTKKLWEKIKGNFFQEYYRSITAYNGVARRHIIQGTNGSVRRSRRIGEKRLHGRLVTIIVQMLDICQDRKFQQCNRMHQRFSSKRL